MSKDGLHVFHRIYNCFLFVWGRVFVSVCSAFHLFASHWISEQTRVGHLTGLCGWFGFVWGRESRSGFWFGFISLALARVWWVNEDRSDTLPGMCDGLNQQNSIWTVKKQQKLGEITKKMVYQPQKWVVSASFSGVFTGKSLFRCSLRRPKRNTAGVAGALIGTALKAAAAAAVAVAWPRVRGVGTTETGIFHSDLVGGLEDVFFHHIWDVILPIMFFSIYV